MKISTVGEARELSGPGTRIYWRPGFVASFTEDNPATDNQLAEIHHVSTKEDKYYAQRSKVREAIGKQ